MTSPSLTPFARRSIAINAPHRLRAFRAHPPNQSAYGWLARRPQGDINKNGERAGAGHNERPVRYLKQKRI